MSIVTAYHVKAVSGRSRSQASAYQLRLCYCCRQVTFNGFAVIPSQGTKYTVDEAASWQLSGLALRTPDITGTRFLRTGYFVDIIARLIISRRNWFNAWAPPFLHLRVLVRLGQEQDS